INAEDIVGQIPIDDLDIRVGGSNLVIDSGFLMPTISATATSHWALYNNGGSGAGRELRIESPGRGFGNWIVAKAGATPGSTLGIVSQTSNSGVVGGWTPDEEYTISWYALVPSGSPLLGRTMRAAWNTAPAVSEEVANPPL